MSPLYRTVAAGRDAELRPSDGAGTGTLAMLVVTGRAPFREEGTARAAWLDRRELEELRDAVDEALER